MMRTTLPVKTMGFSAIVGFGRLSLACPSLGHALPGFATKLRDQPLAHQLGGAGDIVLGSGRQERSDVIEKRGRPELGGQVRFELRARDASIAFFQIALEALCQSLIAVPPRNATARATSAR